MPIPAELKSRYDRCVKKVMANGGKPQVEAQSICELSLTSMKPAKKPAPKPLMTIASADPHFVFFSSSKLNAEKNGVVLKNVEIFRVGTFKGYEYKKSALEKMVANFYYLKSMGIFTHVPVRSDHPGFLGEVGVVDRVGGYVKDLYLRGNKLVADVRITSEKMLAKIKEGSYVSRSSEIGNYTDNEGNTYGPTLWGFAFVDIPAVEGLSPEFSFSAEKPELISLNSEDMHVKEHGAEGAPVEEPVVAPAPVADEPVEPVVETPVETVEEKEEIVEEVAGGAPSLADEPAEELVESTEEEEVDEEEATVEPVVTEPVVETPVEEAPAETPEAPVATLAAQSAIEKFAKEFPEQFAELQKLKKEKIDGMIQSLVTNGRILPAQKDKMSAFVKDLSDAQLVALSAIFNEMPSILKLNEDTVETVPQEEPEKGGEAVDENAKAEANADEFLEKTK
jgi:hypothetical protein